MRILKTRSFKKWATRESLTDKHIAKAVAEMEQGLVDAELGGGLVKKRIAMGSRGKRAGARTIIAYQRHDKAFFVYGFKKNEKSNLDVTELVSLKQLGELLLNFSEAKLKSALVVGELYEVGHEKE